MLPRLEHGYGHGHLPHIAAPVWGQFNITHNEMTLIGGLLVNHLISHRSRLSVSVSRPKKDWGVGGFFQNQETRDLIPGIIRITYEFLFCELRTYFHIEKACTRDSINHFSVK